MGTGTNNPDSKEAVKCGTCGGPYSPLCDYRQGRCPGHPPPIDIYRARFYNLFQSIKRFFNK
jgi:hypothetical protein